LGWVWPSGGHAGPQPWSGCEPPAVIIAQVSKGSNMRDTVLWPAWTQRDAPTHEGQGRRPAHTPSTRWRVPHAGPGHQRARCATGAVSFCACVCYEQAPVERAVPGRSAPLETAKRRACAPAAAMVDGEECAKRVAMGFGLGAALGSSIGARRAGGSSVRSGCASRFGRGPSASPWSPPPTAPSS
jgi:hypothetical protein